MPELPEVETVRANVEKTCSGRIMLSVKVIDPGVLEGCSAKELASFTRNRAVKAVFRHGKQMFIELEGDGFVTVHLGMTGDLVFKPRKEEPGKHDRVLFDFKDGSQLAYEDLRKFGAIGITASIDLFVKGKGLGPDALEIKREVFVSRVIKHRRAIKTVLLDQKVVAGIGNLYADEVLFQSRIHPLRLANEMNAREADALFKNMRKVLMASVRVSSDFDLLPKGFMLAVRGPGALCPRGNGKMTSIRVNGRTTFFCPSCQSL